MREPAAMKEEAANASVDKKLNRRHLNCDHCPPHRGENRGRRVKHGPQKPKYKNGR
jgi:hypothetical protein